MDYVCRMGDLERDSRQNQWNLPKASMFIELHMVSYGQSFTFINHVYVYIIRVYTCVTGYIHEKIREQPQTQILLPFVLFVIVCFVFVCTKQLSHELVFLVILPLGSWIREMLLFPSFTKAVKVQAQLLVLACQILLSLRCFFSPWSNSKSEKSTEDKD